MINAIRESKFSILIILRVICLVEYGILKQKQ